VRILYIAYPLLTVSQESAGGAEQVLWTLEREMAHRGVITTVAASAGSTVTGELFSTGDPCSTPDDFDRRNRQHQERVLELIDQRTRQGEAFDLIHDMSGSFWEHAAQIQAPVLATLHLPRDFYSPRLFDYVAPNVSFNCVSAAQAKSFAGLDAMAGTVGNGIDLDRFASPLCLRAPDLGFEEGVARAASPKLRPGAAPAARSGLLWLGRICPEKAPHLALEIARRAGRSITLAGQVYPFSYHRRYFDDEVGTRLRIMPDASFLPSPCAEEKAKLLRGAQAVLITSQVDETSSLVAMEAAASGTPVIGFARGALPEVVREGVTGFMVQVVDEAVRALRHLHEIESEACRQHARDHFSSATMADGYAALYARILSRAKTPLCPA
jgi:glycosyltransferase involved in cell wall biosynthesis